MRVRLGVVALVLSLWASGTTTYAEPDAAGIDPDDVVGFGDLPPDETATDDDVGFAALDPETETETTEARRPRPVITSSLRLDGAMWSRRLGDDGFAKARTSLDLALTHRVGHVRLSLAGHAAYDFAYLYRPDTHDDATRDAYAWVVRPGETFVALDQAAFTLSAGFQTFAWGDAELFSVLDVIGPRDYREPAHVPAALFRLPVLSTYLVFPSGAHRVELVAQHEARFGLRPPPLGDFSPIRQRLLEDSALAVFADALRDRNVFWRDTPRRFSLDAQQFFGRYLGTFGPTDVAFVLASMLEPTGIPSLDPSAVFDDGPLPIALAHPRFAMVGGGLSHVHGAFILRGEVAFDVARPVALIDLDTLALDVERRTLVRFMLGARYQYRVHTIVLEYADGTRDDLTRSTTTNPGFTPLFPLGYASLGAGFSGRFARERLELEGFAGLFGDRLRGGGLVRLALSYALRDALRVSVGYVLYRGGPEASPLSGFSDVDRVLVSLRWDAILFGE